MIERKKIEKNISLREEISREIGGEILIEAVSMRGPTFQSGSAPLI